MVQNIVIFLFISSDMSCRSRLATLNEKLTALERRIEYIEARVRFSFRQCCDCSVSHVFGMLL